MRVKLLLTALALVSLCLSNFLFVVTLNAEETGTSILEKLIEQRAKTEETEKEQRELGSEEYETGYQKGYEEAIKILGYERVYQEGYQAAKREKLEYERGYEEGFKKGYAKARQYWQKRSYNIGVRRGILNTACCVTPILIFLLTAIH